MRLSEILSRNPKSEYVQVDGFLQNRKGYTGQRVNIEIGQIVLNYFCMNCKDNRSFFSGKRLSCIFVNKKLISLDCVLSCYCGTSIPMWFLIESKDDITGQAPEVRILERHERLRDAVDVTFSNYGEIGALLNKAEQAYNRGFGAGAIVYLRKIFEVLTVQTAKTVGIEYDAFESGNPRNFSGLLRKVDEECKIIPEEFSANRYKLFQELSEVVHGNFNEELGLVKFRPLERLVIGILENIKNRRELKEAITTLGWEIEEK